jgi:hypothetical protein
MSLIAYYFFAQAIGANTSLEQIPNDRAFFAMGETRSGPHWIMRLSCVVDGRCGAFEELVSTDSHCCANAKHRQTTNPYLRIVLRVESRLFMICSFAMTSSPKLSLLFSVA